MLLRKNLMELAPESIEVKVASTVEMEDVDPSWPQR
jgi:hypothetical protein